MRVLDLFSGLGGFSQAFKERGHEVVTVDIEPHFKPTICGDVTKIKYPSLSLKGDFDVVLASPPCQAFSFANQMNGPIPPEKQRDGLGVVASAFRLISEIHPRWFVVENPRGHLRKYIGPPKELIYLCTYGSDMRKPTDFWGKWPKKLKKTCKHSHHVLVSNSSTGEKTPYDHQSDLRAKLPYGLSNELCKQMEESIAK